MHLTRLALTDFRSYPELSLELGPGVTTFSGPNGAGKTNLVEAIGYLATLGSHRVATDAPLVRRGADRAVLRAAVTGAQGTGWPSASCAGTRPSRASAPPCSSPPGSWAKPPAP